MVEKAFHLNEQRAANGAPNSPEKPGCVLHAVGAHLSPRSSLEAEDGETRTPDLRPHLALLLSYTDP